MSTHQTFSPKDQAAFAASTSGDEPLNIVADPGGRAICGMSAGGICAFTVAWEHPEAFSKVVSRCGSFVDHDYEFVDGEGGHTPVP